MKKSFILCCIFFSVISTNKLFAQASDADSSIVNDDAVAQINVPESSIKQNEKLAVTVGAKIYPNPVRDELHIDGLDPKLKTHISISSSYGRIVYQSKTSGTDTYLANVQKLKPGIYYITIKVDGDSMLLKFLKE
jgi:hypothetical protein